LNSHH